MTAPSSSISRRRPPLGIELKTESIGFKDIVKIVAFAPGSLAAASGLVVGTVLTVNGTPVEDECVTKLKALAGNVTVGIAPRPFVIHKPTAATPVGIVLVKVEATARSKALIKADSLTEGGLLRPAASRSATLCRPSTASSLPRLRAR